MKRLLAIFAHPDDEAFGPGGTLAKYGSEGVEIHLLCATKGEEGNQEPGIRNQESGINSTGHIREKELLESAKVLGIKKVEFLGFKDGRLCNAIYHEMAEKIIKKIKKFKPQIILTHERRGVSGHLDHIAVSMITTFAFKKTKIASKLYYYCIPKETRDEGIENYFIYFPEGYDQKEITTRIDYTFYREIKAKAMKSHRSQAKDVETLLARFKRWPKTENFILQYQNNIKNKLPETDLFAGINH